MKLQWCLVCQKNLMIEEIDLGISVIEVCSKCKTCVGMVHRTESEFNKELEKLNKLKSLRKSTKHKY